MPMYDYRCDRCETQFEVRQSFSDDTLTACPEAGGPSACTAPGRGPVRKVFTGVGVLFKGDGFYKNDHGSNADGRRKEREAAKESSPSGSSDSSGGSDSGSSDSGGGSGSSGPGESGSSGSGSSKPAGGDSSRSKSGVSQTTSP